LVKGHYWEFNGKGATPSVSERWLDENKEWMGSNFFDVPSKNKVYFRNNPFNYTHYEEQYVTNPEAKILIDYQAYHIPREYSYYHNAIVATYQMNFGEGNIINLGIWGHTLRDNKAFLKYFDNVIIPLALGPLVNSTQYLDKFSSHLNNNTLFISVPATSPSGAVVNYLLPSAMNNIDSKFIPVCSHPPGSIFPKGQTIVKCTATDKPDNKTAIATFTVQVTAEPCVNYNTYTNTITVRCTANLSKINQIVNDRSVLEKDPHGVWILNAKLKVSPLAKLIINRTDTSWLKITNQLFHENEPNFILISGDAKIDGVKITSWDPFSTDVIRQNVNGSISRPYILINNSSGTANISNSEIAFLGFAANSKYGVSYNSGGGGSRIINNTFHDMWDGFYSNSIGFITIKNNKYYDNLKYGIAMYQSSNDKIYNNLVESRFASIYIAGSSLGNHVYNNTIMNCTFGFYFADNKSKNNLFENNNLHKITYPIMINGIDNVGRNNGIYSK
jgi:parallel beta-helix repeat protein